MLVVDNEMQGVRCVVGVAWFILDGMGAWEARGEGLMEDEMSGAVNMGREVLTFVGIEVLFETIETYSRLIPHLPCCMKCWSNITFWWKILHLVFNIGY